MENTDLFEDFGIKSETQENKKHSDKNFKSNTQSNKKNFHKIIGKKKNEKKKSTLQTVKFQQTKTTTIPKT